MFRRLGIAIWLASAAAAGGCADLMSRSTIAPEWFKAKAMEVEGQGYPELSKVPQARGDTKDQAEWEAAAAALKTKAEEMEKQVSKADALPTEEDIRAREAQLRALLEKGSAPRDGVQP